MRIQGVLFDKDGTLLDFDKTWNRVAGDMALHVAEGDKGRAQELLETVGFDPERKVFLPGSIWAAGNNFDLAEAWFPDLSGPEQLQKAAFFDEFVTKLSPEVSVPLTDLNAVLGKLRAQDLLLGIATNDVTESANGFVRVAGLEEHLSFVVGYDGVENPKPYGDMVRAFSAHASIETNAIAVVGDNTHDLEMATEGRAGLKVGVLTGTGTRAELEPLADIILDSIDDLPAYLSQVNGHQAA